MTRPLPAAPLTVNQLEFGDPLALGVQKLFAVMAGGRAEDAVARAADFAEGMSGLIRHMNVSTDAGELVFTSELKVLAFLSDTIHALTCAADLAMTRAAKEGI